MGKIRCYCCEKELPEGSLKYIVEIKSFADFDGHIEECPDDLNQDMKELLEDMDDIEQSALEEDVYNEMLFVLCKECRDRFCRNPFNNSKGIQSDEEFKGIIH